MSLKLMVGLLRLLIIMQIAHSPLLALEVQGLKSAVKNKAKQKWMLNDKEIEALKKVLSHQNILQGGICLCSVL